LTIIRRRTASDAGFPVGGWGGDDGSMATYVILLVVVLFVALGLLGLLYYILNRAEHERQR
jgi:hypothetical protein